MENLAGEPVSRILFGAALASLLRDDHSSSPGLATGIERPTRGFILPCRLHRRRKGACCFRRAQRAGPALPSYLVLHHAGFAVPAPLLAPRWALTPPFHPYLRCVPSKDIPKVFLRAITGIRPAGGIFSVALSVTRSLRTASPGVTRRVAQSCSYGSAETVHALQWCPDFPPVLACSAGFIPPFTQEPAIIQLTRQPYYICNRSFPTSLPKGIRRAKHPFNECPRS